MTYGGKRAGAGRKPGAINKRARAVVDAATATGKPLFLDGLLQAFYETKETAESFPLHSPERLEVIGRMADICAKGMPYLYPKLANVEHTGEDGGPIQHTHNISERKARLAALMAQVKTQEKR